MSTIYFYTLFDQSSKKPRCAGIKIGDKTIVYDLFRPGANKLLKTISSSLKKISNFLIESNDRGHDIVTSNFKSILTAYNLPIDKRHYNIYDVHIDTLGLIKPREGLDADTILLNKILDKMASSKHHSYQKLISNAAVVYQDLQNTGLYINDTIMHPEWSMMTFSGRSKSLGFNIQGYYEEHKIRTISSTTRDVLLHFDWVSADIRAASLMSGDDLLISSFDKSDPYTMMVDNIGGSITRDECKLFLLKSINSMSIHNNAISEMFPKLDKWIQKCYEATRGEDGYLETLLHRRFKVANAKNSLAVLNGAMQGSVAHAMQNVIRKVWEIFSINIIAEIHDSIVLCVPNDSVVIRSIIDAVVPIMLYPFADLLDYNPSFPLRVSIGKNWKQWKLLEIHRSSGVERVKGPRKTTKETEEKDKKVEETAKEDSEE